ncbi:MAG: tripartite tricarboxylate transporter substrate-binding protein [Burkholderiales bacterium]
MRVPTRFLLAVFLVIGCGAAAAQQDLYPQKPVRLIVPIAPGSVTDVIARAASRDLTPRLQQTLVVDNRAGATGIIGAELCARATPDGYTICNIYTATTSINPHVIDKLPYDPVKDFKPITNLYFVTGALVVPASLPVKSVAELMTLATSQPKALSFGTIGAGSYPEMFLAWLNDRWKTSITPIPYKGGGPIAVALLANEIQLTAVGLGNMVGPLQSGQLRALAVSSAKRSRLLPGVPVFAEAGLGAFNGHLWWGLAAPAATPDRIIMRLNSEFAQLFREPKFVAFLEDNAVEPATGTPGEFAAFMQRDREAAAKLIAAMRKP